MSAAGMIGRSKAELDTPALLVDLDVMEANIDLVATECRARGVGWRPHSKAHKTPEIARLQIAAGAIGITCAKLGEAEVMAAAGIDNILIANQIVGAQKVARLMELGRVATVIVAVDSIDHLVELDAAARHAGRRQEVVIEVDLGMGRAGVAPGAPVVVLASKIAARDGLVFAGLMTWESHAVAIADGGEKERVVSDALSRLVESAADCRRAGMPARILSCGGTGTFPHCVRHGGITEVQVGGAIFADMRYRNKFFIDLPASLTIQTTVISRPTPTRIVVDAGKKAMSGDGELPEPIGLPPHASLGLSAEHATVTLREPSNRPRIGDRLEFIVGYSDTTVHLHEEIVGIRDGRVESVWAVAARGRLA